MRMTIATTAVGNPEESGDDLTGSEEELKTASVLVELAGALE